MVIGTLYPIVRKRPVWPLLPRQQVVYASDLVIGNAGDGVCEPGLGINAVELCSLDQGVYHSGGTAASRCSVEEVLRPKAMARMARSAVLLSSSRMPFVRYGLSRHMRVSVYRMPERAGICPKWS